MNLKNETLTVLHNHGKKKSDVRWAGCEDFKIPLNLFWELADQEYDSGFGAQEVAEDLIVVGDGFWLERHEYDGSEWWEYKESCPAPTEVKTVHTLIGRLPGLWWTSLSELNSRSPKGD